MDAKCAPVGIRRDDDPHLLSEVEERVGYAPGALSSREQRGVNVGARLGEERTLADLRPADDTLGSRIANLVRGSPWMDDLWQPTTAKEGQEPRRDHAAGRSTEAGRSRLHQARETEVVSKTKPLSKRNTFACGSPGPAGRSHGAFNIVHAPSAPAGAARPEAVGRRRSRPSRHDRAPSRAFVAGARSALRSPTRPGERAGAL